MANELPRLAYLLIAELDPYERFGFVYQQMEELLDRFLDDPQLRDEPEIRGLQEALEAFDGVRHRLTDDADRYAFPPQRWSKSRWEGLSEIFVDGEITPGPLAPSWP